MSKVRLQKQQEQKSVHDFLFKEYAFTISFIGIIVLAMILFLAICFMLIPATGGFYWW